MSPAPSPRERTAATRDPSWSVWPEWATLCRQIFDDETERLQSTTRYLAGELLVELAQKPWRVARWTRRAWRLARRPAAPPTEQRLPPRLPPSPHSPTSVDANDLRRARERVLEAWKRLRAVQLSSPNQLGDQLAAVASRPAAAAARLGDLIGRGGERATALPPPPPIESDYPFVPAQLASDRPRWAVEGPQWLVDMAERERGCVRLIDAKEPPEVVLIGVQDGAPLRDDALDRALDLKRQGSRVALWHLGRCAAQPSPAMRELAARADAIVADEAATVGALGQRFEQPIGLMSPAVQPLLHNPIGWWSRATGPAPEWEHSGDVPESWIALFAAARGREIGAVQRSLCEAVLRRPIPEVDAGWGSHASAQSRFVLLRHVLDHASMGRRLDELRLRIGLPSAEVVPPLVSVVVATHRPQRVGDVLANFRRQRYPNKELVLVLHGDGFSRAELDRVTRDGGERVRIVPASASWTLGACLQRGVEASEGAIIAKMDDDDWYGRRYLTDMLMALRFSCAGVVCKPCFVVSIEGVERLQLCRRKLEYEYGWFSAGASLVMRRALLDLLPFGAMPAGEDSRLCRDSVCHSIPVLGADRFNFVVRRHALAQHTWKISPREMLQSYGATPLPSELAEVDLDT